MAGNANSNDIGARYPSYEQEHTKCADFLRSFTYGGYEKYRQQLQEIANRDRVVLEISIDDIYDYRNDIEFVENIKRNTLRYIRHFEDVADNLMPAPETEQYEADVFDILENQRQTLLQNAPLQNQANDDANDGVSNARPRTDIPQRLLRRFEVSIIPSNTDTPRRLRDVLASDIGHLIKVRGLVTRATDVKPHVAVCTYLCESCGAEVYQEIGGPQFMPYKSCPSQRCQDNKTLGKITMQSRGSRFVKYQELRLQELPDQVPVGHIPRSMTVHCRGEQTRKAGPGDIIVVSGVFQTERLYGYRAMKAGLQTDTYLEACLIEKEKVDYSALELDAAAATAVQSVCRDPDPYGRLAASIAPEIFGHEDVKKALLLQLVGGSTRELPDGMKIRGDINICLMGDPGVAKSQLLKYIAAVAPRGVYTTGKGSSGVGLTAAVVRDNMTGEMALEGGALVLADMGICCIDEFDKMEEGDRTAIHEVMEQQTISIAKAGITTTLNARAAVLAAANPLYGRYNKKRSISENIDLPNSLLSRFDLLFLIIDKVDMEQDLALSRHVLHVHKYLKNPQRAFEPLVPDVIKQYIAAARTVQPSVPQDLTSYIVEAYVSLRTQDAASAASSGRGGGARGGNQTMMTARQLLSILRLGQALARLRLSQTVSYEDIDEAIRLTHASKASLSDDEARPRGQEDVISAIYSAMRDLAAVGGVGLSGHGLRTGGVRLPFAQIEATVLRKGFTAHQLQACLLEYDQLGVLSLSHDGSYVDFED